jgi:hypothetical protein
MTPTNFNDPHWGAKIASTLNKIVDIINTLPGPYKTLCILQVLGGIFFLGMIWRGMKAEYMMMCFFGLLAFGILLSIFLRQWSRNK